MASSANTSQAVLSAENLAFAYPGQSLFADWSASIGPGVTLLRGGDGRGKTTLLRLLAGELAAQAGRLQIKGTRLDEQPVAYQRQVFWTAPRTDAHDALTTDAWLESLRQRYPSLDMQVWTRLIDGLSLTPHQGKPVYMLSTGTKRKLWLAGAFASGAAVTLLDEPFAALDKPSIQVVTELLQEAAQHPTRAWIVAHHEAPEGVELAGVIDLGE